MDEVSRISTLIIRYLIEKRVLVVGAGVGVVALLAGPVGALAAGAGFTLYEVLSAVGLSSIRSVLLSIIPTLAAFDWAGVLQALVNVGRLLMRLLRDAFGSGTGKEQAFVHPHIGFH